MEPISKSLFIKRVLFVCFFGLLSIFTLYWFIYEFMRFKHQFINLSAIINFDKSAVYLLGLSLLGGWITYASACEVFGITISLATAKKSSYFMYLSMGILLLLPHLSKFGVNYYMDKIGYHHCRALSTQWMSFETLVYTANPQICYYKQQAKEDEQALVRKLRQERMEAARSAATKNKSLSSPKSSYFVGDGEDVFL